jgi:hypothetical protein
MGLAMCLVQILEVNGIGGTPNPTDLKVTGRLTDCPSGNVLVTSTLTAPSVPLNITYYPGGGFVAIIPFNAPNVACDDPVNVRVECDRDPGCFDSFNGPLHCCEVVVSTFHALVAPGSLTPSAISVTGTARGCIGDQVTVSSAVFGASPPIDVDPVTGSFSTVLPITTPVDCGDRVTVAAQCFGDPDCPPGTRSGPLDCPQCARAQVSITKGSCTGNPPTQPITLAATINIAGGTTRFFRWFYGDASQSPVFEIDNTAGTPTTPHAVPPYPALAPAFPVIHNYPPGSYIAELVVTDARGRPLECDRIPFALVAVCDQCPAVTVASSAPGPCVNGKRKVVLSATVSSLPSPTAFQWLFGDGTVGLARAVTAPGPWPPTANAAVNEHEYGPGIYTAELTNIDSPDCPSQKVTIIVPPCPSTTTCCPTVTLDAPQVTGCAPSSAAAAFNAVLGWPPGCTPVAPTSFEWTLHGSGGRKYQKSTSLSSTDTSVGWTDTGGNPLVVQFSSGGNYSLTVTAVIPGISLPCNPTDTVPFTVSACCPQMIGPLITSQVDSCTFIFSAQLQNPSNAAVTFEWTFHDGSTAVTAVPQISHTYTVGSITTGTTTVTLKSPNCPDVMLSTSVTHACFCPPVGTTGAVLTGTGCAPGAGVALSTSVPGATSFDWTVTTPAATPFSKTTAAAATTDGTADGAWTNATSGSTGPLDLSAPGAYAVSVRAKGASISSSCPQPPTMAFTVPACPGPAPSFGCILLLVLALLFLTAAAILFVIAACVPPSPATPFLWGFGIAALVIGLVLLILWGLFCAALMCRVLNALAWIFSFLTAASGIIAFILFFFHDPCAAGAFADAVDWGLALAVVGWIAGFTRCRIFTTPI